jgi:hypothetical protein
LTLCLAPTEALKSKLRALGAGERVTLLVEDLKVRGAEPVAVRIFLNKPEANEKTLLRSPNYVTSVSLFPVGQQGGYNYIVDLTSTLSRLADAKLVDPDQGLSITLVAVPLRPGTGQQVEILAARVRLPDSPG